MDWWHFDPAAYAVGDALYIEEGSWDYTVAEYKVAKITPSGQIVASRTYANGHKDEIRLTRSGRFAGAGQWNRRRVVSAERAAETRLDMANRQAWGLIRKGADALSKAAVQRDADALHAAMVELAAAAQGIEARRAVDAEGGAVGDESPVGNADAPN